MNVAKRAAIRILDRTLPDSVKRSLVNLAFNVNRPRFDELAVIYRNSPSMASGLKAAASLGLAPSTVIDIGAFDGEWSRLAKRIWPTSNLILIEPNHAKCENLLGVAQDLDAQFHAQLLGAENDKEVTFHVMGSGSSVMEEQSPVPRTAETRKLATLDRTVGASIIGPVLIKIDAQGYELEILKGARHSLSMSEAVLLEVSTIEINRGAPLLHEVVRFMKDAGFVVYDILGIHRRPLDGALNQLDFMFVRNESVLRSDKRHFARGASRTRRPTPAG